MEYQKRYRQWPSERQELRYGHAAQLNGVNYIDPLNVKAPGRLYFTQETQNHLKIIEYRE